MLNRLVIVISILLTLVHCDLPAQCTPVIGTNPSPPKGCELFTVQFFDSTDCIIQQRIWSFGDGVTSTVENPIHSFNASVAGEDTVYNVELAVQDIVGIWTSTSVSVTVYDKPEASFTMNLDTACAINDLVVMTNNSVVGADFSYNWDYGDLTAPGSSLNSNHIYNNPGDYTVTLTITDTNGCSQIFQEPITINEIPNPNFALDAIVGCHPMDVVITNTTVPGTFPITDWSWNYSGQATEDTEESSGHTFLDPGIFAITLSAINSAGCSNSTSNNVFVNETPTPDFMMPEEGCKGDTVIAVYTGTGTNAGTYTWTASDNANIINGGRGPIQVAWDSTGAQILNLEIEENGCTSTGLNPIQVHGLPVVELFTNALKDSICEAQEITFTALPDSFVTFSFFNLDTILLQNSPENEFETSTLDPNNEISVFAVDSNQCESSATSSIGITVLPKPVVSISSDLDTICVAEEVTFSATNGYDYYEWFKGFLSLIDSSTNMLTTPTLEDGDEIHVVATQDGCSGEPSNRVETTVIPPLSIPQLNCGNSNNNNVNFIWNEVEGALGYEVATSTQITTGFGAFDTTTFNDKYTVGGLSPGDTVWAKLVAHGKFPCGNSIQSNSIFCIAQPCDTMLFIPSVDTSLCFGDSALLNISNIITPSSGFAISWNNGLFGKDTSFWVRPFVDSTINVAFIDSFQLGCPAYSHDFLIAVNTRPAFNLEVSGDTICFGDAVEIQSSLAGYDNYSLSLNDTVRLDSTFHIYTSSSLMVNSYDVRMVVTDKGCTSSDTASFVISKPSEPIFTTNSDSICQGERIIYSVNEDYLYYNFYNPTDAVYQDSTISVFSTYNSNINSVYFVGEDSYGCKTDPVLAEVVIKGIPETDILLIIGDEESCVGDSVFVQASNSTYDFYELWNDYSIVEVTESHSFWLLPDSGSSYFVRPVHLGCVGINSDTLNFTTSQPLDIPQVNCGLTGNGSMRFVWDEIDRSEEYIVVENNSGVEIAPSGGANPFHFVSGLNSSDTFCIQVKAVGPAPCGDSEWSEPVCCVMPCQPVDFDLNYLTHEVCEGDSVTLQIYNISSPTDNYAVSWNGNELGDTLIQRYAPSASEEVTVMVTDTSQAHCIPTTKTFEIIVNDLPNITLFGDTLLCGDEEAVLIAGPDVYNNYQFFDGFLPIASGANPTQIDRTIEDGHTYSVVAEENGCYDTSNFVTIQVVDKIQQPEIYCGQSSISNIEFRWDSIPNATGYEISINGFPWVTPNSGNLGFSNNSIAVSAGDSIIAKVRALTGEPCNFSEESELITCFADACGFKNFTKTFDFEACEGDLVTLNIDDITSPSSEFYFSWNDVDFTKDTVIQLAIFQDTTVNITMIDSSQIVCSSLTKEINISIQETPIMTVLDNFQNDSLCEGQLLELTADTIGYDAYQFFIDDVLVQDSLFYQFSTDELTPGTHEVKVESQDNGCSYRTDSALFEVVPFPEISLFGSDLNDTICRLDSIDFFTNDIFDIYEFYVDGIQTQVSISDTLTTDALNDGAEVYLIGVNQNLCRRTSDTLITTVIDIPTVSLLSSDPDDNFCAGDTIIFNAEPSSLDSLIIYLNGDSILAIDSLVFLIDTLQDSDEIFVIGSEAGCPSSSNAISNQVDFRPTATAISDTSQICIGDQVILEVSGGDSYLWSTGSNQELITVSPNETTLYTVTTTTGACTSWSDSILVQVDVDQPVADAGVGEIICRGDSIQLFGLGGDNFHWITDSVSNDSISDPFVSPFDTRTFVLEVINTYCRDTSEITITIDRCLTDLPEDIPEIITPNGDGDNDVLYIRDIDYFTNCKLTIFNRWSNIVYESQPYNNEWYGQNKKGKNLPDGTYFYILELGGNFPVHRGYVIIHH